MNKKTLGLILLVNIVVISLGALAVYYDLWMRQYSSYPYEPIRPIKVEWYFLGYRATYIESGGAEVQGSWTLDYLQLSIILMAIVDIVLLIQYRLTRDKPSSS
jgi:hypothetical protein